MMAAAKLHPEATIVFSGSQEKNVRDFLADTEFPLHHRRLRGFDIHQVREVVVVDASAAGRLGPFAELVGKPGVVFDIYDHHTGTGVDIPHRSAVILPRGATSTIMVELLREREIPITPAEATLLALGIYEDTGSLTFSSVTEADFEACRWLLAQGAELATVAQYLNRELSPEQIDTLNTLLKSLRYERAHGISVALATAIRPRYTGDVATLVTKIMDIENLPILFALVQMDDRIQLVARSRIEGVDAGGVARRFGGGGHPSAASATIREMTLPQAVDRLWAILDDIVERPPTAGEVMTTHVITCAPDEPIDAVERRMTRYDINGVPVVEGGKPVGLITRQIVEKAIHHRMGGHPTADFMLNEFAVVHPDTPMRGLEDLTLQDKQKQAPVVDPTDGELVGLVTRGMVMAKMYGDTLKAGGGASFQGRSRRHPITRDVAGLMRERLPESILALFADVTAVADRMNAVAYVAGGFVRDLLLRIPNVDVDIVVEGDGVSFARALAERLSGRARVHQKFKTAVVTLPGGFKIDVATARIEYYAYPAALPTVAVSAIRDDLYRRDFSMNAMAIRLNGDKPNYLIDYFGGQADIKDHVIRVLHNLSFVEDPTRAFRAVRFETRYGFAMGKQTLTLLKNAVKNRLFHRLSPGRLFAELRLMLQEKRPLAALARLDELELLSFIHPSLTVDEELKRLMDRVEDMVAWGGLTFPDEEREEWLPRFFGLVDRLDSDELATMAERFGAGGREVETALRVRTDGIKTVRRLTGEPEKPGDATLYALLSPLPVEGLLYLAARVDDPRVAEGVTRYLTRLRGTTPLITGADLREAGMPAGPAMGEALSSAFAAQLDGRVTTREEAIALVMRGAP